MGDESVSKEPVRVEGEDFSEEVIDVDQTIASEVIIKEEVIEDEEAVDDPEVDHRAAQLKLIEATQSFKKLTAPFPGVLS
ncbi:hypothetical protein GE061_018309 [Apolygus lucorum]|uniref:Uncharacterized protein n=1 Tax=Apolygus lucorum TaxID=248454 RepID=A0A8S9XDF2_APOLU|nr:hypothetical protein GE061_018309 [Apolygus lucorum]